MKAIQKEILNVYKEIKRVCEKNKIPYFAIGGTALGAVRHGGFIPWDDDMDLGIPINFYDQFKQACKKDLKPPYKFSELHFMGGKVHNTNTTFLEAQCIMEKNKHYGVFVDIFPIIGAPNDDTSLSSFLQEMKDYYNKAFIYDRYPEASELTKKQIEDWRTKLIHQNPLESSRHVVEFASGNWFTKNPDGMKHPTIMEFEDTTIPVPSTYNEDLTNQYGNYMKLPPKNQRYTHDVYSLIDIHRPYHEYSTQLFSINPDILQLLQSKHKHEGIFYKNLLKAADDYNNLYSEHQRILKINSQLLSELQQIYQKPYYKLIKKLSSIKARLSSKSDHH